MNTKKSKKRSRDKSTQSCPYHSLKRETRFVEHSFGKIRDIEELVELGKNIHACPYYGMFISIY